MTTRLPQMVLDALERAEAGEAGAWGVLYAAAASYARSGSPMPEPLATVMAQRMQSIANALTSPREKDKRAALHAAAAPGAKRGRKPKAFDMLHALAVDALHMAGEAPSKAQIDEAINYILGLMPRKPGTSEPLYTQASLLLEVEKLRRNGAV